MKMIRLLRPIVFCVIAFLPVVACLSQDLGPPAIGETEGRPRVRAGDASSVVGRKAFVHGRVASIVQRGSVHLLNFEQDNDPPFQAVITSSFRDAFPTSLEEAYVGRHLELYGWVSTYAGRPQIRLRAPDQIERLVSAILSGSYNGERDLIKITTFNVYNLFDSYNDPYRNDATTTVKSREEMEKLAEAIHRIDADILALQEVENRGILERFVEVFLPDLGYREIVHLEGNDVRGIDVALLSRFPVGRVTSYRHMTFSDDSGIQRRLERDLLTVEVLPDGHDPIEVWVVHLKSNWDGRAFAEPVRLAEARFIRGILDQRLAHDPNARIALCGDFNDTWGSRALNAFTAEGAGRLVHLFDDIPEADRITFNKEPYRSMIDFILVSPALARAYITGSSRILSGSVQTIGSDHNPVSAQFRLPSREGADNEIASRSDAQLNAVLWMQTSAEYRAIAMQAYTAAREQLQIALRDDSWTAAFEQEPGYEKLPPAIILDLDEAVLDNSTYQAWLVAEGRHHKTEYWNEWCEQIEAGILPGAVEFLSEAEKRGIHIFYITNRRHTLRDVTIKNLERYRIKVEPGRLLMQGDAPGGSDKTARRKMVASTHRVLLMIGDDFNDFLRAGRSLNRWDLAAEHSHMWGRKWFMLPNPAYGSWERALYGFDYGLEESEKSRLKFKRLHPWKREQQTSAEVSSSN